MRTMPTDSELLRDQMNPPGYLGRLLARKQVCLLPSDQRQGSQMFEMEHRDTSDANVAVFTYDTLAFAPK